MDFDWEGQPGRLIRKAEGWALCRGRDTVWSFDEEGRPISQFEAGDFYQRGLDNRYLHKYRNAEGRQRQLLSTSQLQVRQAQLSHEIKRLSQRFPHPDWELLLRWTPETLAQQSQRFHTIYQPLSILPPDQYLAIVLQLAEGCSYNRCSFCNFYKDRAFRIKPAAAFETHLQAVHALLGKAAQTRKGLFLADGDALMVPQKRLCEAIQQIRQYWPTLPLYSFMDAFRPQAKSQAEFEILVNLGLKRVYLGIESSDPRLLSLLNKPGSPELMQAESLKMKQAGVALGLILMIGAGGRLYAQSHRERSLAWLHALPLDADDRIFLSEFIPHPDQPYMKLAADAGIEPLNLEEIALELAQWRLGLQALPAKVVPYHLQEFIY